MKESNYIMFIVIRLFTALLPLVLGLPMLAFCFCAYNLVMIIVTRGGVYGGIVSAATAAAGGLLCYACGYGLVYSGTFALQLALATSFCSLMVVTRRGFAPGLLMASAGYGIGYALNLKYMADNAGLSIADYMYSGVDTLINESMNTALKDNAQLAAAGVDFDVKELTALIGNAIKSCIPAVIMIGAIIAGYIMMWMVSKSLRGTPFDNRHSFAEIRLNPTAAVFGIIMLALIFVPENMVNIVGINGLLIFSFIAFCGGLSLMEYLLRQKIGMALPRLLIHILIIVGGTIVSAFFPLVNIYLLYALVGVIDSFVSIRKRVTPQQ